MVPYKLIEGKNRIKKKIKMNNHCTVLSCTLVYLCYTAQTDTAPTFSLALLL